MRNDQQDEMVPSYYSTYNKGDGMYYQRGDTDHRAEKYTEPGESTPSPLRNIQQRTLYTNRVRNEPYKMQKFSMYERDSPVAHNAPVYVRHPQAFDVRAQSGSDRPSSQQANHAIGLPSKTNGYDRRSNGYNRKPIVSTARVKRRIPEEWILQPSSGQPVTKQCKTGERPRPNEGSNRPQMSTSGSSSRPQMSTSGSGSRPEMSTSWSGSRPEMNTSCGGSRPEVNTSCGGSRPEVNTSCGGSRPEVSTSRGGSRPEMNTSRGGSRPEMNTSRSGSRPEMNTSRSGSRPEMNTSGAAADPRRVPVGSADPRPPAEAEMILRVV